MLLLFITLQVMNPRQAKKQKNKYNLQPVGYRAAASDAKHWYRNIIPKVLYMDNKI